VIGTMALPAAVFVIPLFVQLTEWRLTENLVVLGLAYAAWNAGFGTYLMYAYFDGLPAEIIEAAKVDGASELQQLFRLLLPLSRPAIATLAALSFLWSWSDLLISLVLIQDPSHRTITSAVASLADQYSTNTPRLAAGVLIALVPTLIVFAFGQRYIARGITAGVGK
jgi:ABC-type glycerol-3-phosphate transport system permease component